MWILEYEIPGHYSNLKTHASLAMSSLTSKNELLISNGNTLIDKIQLNKSIAFQEWNQNSKILFIAWDDASISIYDAHDKSMIDGKLHSAPVVQLNVSEGNKFITVDADNHVVVWKYDSRKRLSSLTEYRINHQISKVLIINGNSKEPITFYLVCNDGIVYYADDLGHCAQLSQTFPHNVQDIYYVASKGLIIAVTRDLVVTKMSIENDGKLRQNQIIKLGLQSNSAFLTALIHDESLVISVPGQELRVYNFAAEDDSSVVTRQLKMNDSEIITTIDWKRDHSLLLTSTNLGTIYIYKILDSKMNWQPLQTIISKAIGTCTAQWGRNDDIFVKRDNGVQLYTFRIRQCATYANIYSIQVSGTNVMIASDKMKHIVQSKNGIKRISLCDQAVGIWTGLDLEVYKFAEDSIDSSPSLKLMMERSVFGVHKSGVYIATGNALEVYNFSGVKKHTIIVHEQPINNLSIGHQILALVAGDDLKVYDIQRREPRLIATKSLSELSNIRDIQINMNSSIILLQASFASSNSSISQLFFYDILNDHLLNYTVPADTIVSRHVWDTNDPRLLACEVEIRSQDLNEAKISTLYVLDSEIGEISQSSVPQGGSLFQSSVPCQIYLTEVYRIAKIQGQDQDKIENILIKEKLKNYESIADEDSVMVKTMTDFSIFLKLGKIDDAVRAVRLINNPQIWKTLARMSIKSKRLDIARICLSKIGDAKALRSLRELDNETDEAKFGLIAINLGLYEDAQEIYESNQRKDLVNNLYQFTGKWESSLDSANFIGQRKEFFKFATYLSSIGDIIGAIAAFEKAGNSHIQIPRMLYKLRKIQQLKEYIDLKEDPNLYKWWAQYMESLGNLEEAIKYYEKAQDTLSLCRMYCFAGEMEKSIQLIEVTKNVTAAYHLARYCEDNNKASPLEAVNYYAKSNCFGNAIEVCKEYKLDGELMRLALQGTTECMKDVARYFESCPEHLEKAILLYRKSGLVGRALELSLKHKLYQSLSEIIIHEKINSSLLEKCAHIFMENAMYDKAVFAYFNCGNASKAIKVCQEHKVLLTEELVENIKCSESDTLELAQLCMSQRLYILACKKYMQAGQKLKAMEALLRSGDKEKIIYFANILGREVTEIYIMAGNYLQSLDWRNDSSILKAIITFYSKAKSYESLVSFYESCAQIQVLEYSNYVEAVSANKEALKYAQKSNSKRISKLESIIANQEKFLRLDKSINSIQDLKELLNYENSGVKTEDIYRLLLEIYYNNGDLEDAKAIVEKVSRIDPKISKWLGIREELVKETF